MKFIKIINEDYYDRNLLKTSGMKPIVDAIQNRRPITFMYRGPAKGKESVKTGTRKSVEPVALGLTKKNKLAIRAWVPSPNTSKKGLEKNQWRTFLLSRMSNIKFDLNKNYDGPKPGFEPAEKEGNPLWPLIKIYVSTDFNNEPKKPKKTQKPTVKPSGKKPTEPSIEPQVEPTKPEMEPTEPQVEPTPQVEPKPEIQPTNKPEELPQPEPKQKPSKTPPRINSQEPSSTETPTPTPQNEPNNSPEEDEDNNLTESIKRIKRLMFL